MCVNVSIERRVDDQKETEARKQRQPGYQSVHDNESSV
jgi:hypothetical protein